MARAQDIITDAYGRINRLSPGEALSADDAAYGLRTLNLLVDELGAQAEFLFQSVLTSAPATGPITLGAGAWAAISPGDSIISATANNLPMQPLTMARYNEIYQPTAPGLPTVWASDGYATVYLWPVPTGQTIKLQTRGTCSKFADLATDYILLDGWTAALGAGLAVRIAPALLGKLPPELIRAEKICMGAVSRYEPAIIDVDSFTRSRGGYFPPRLF